MANLKRGNKRFEGTNHLGNVLVVYSDKRLIGACNADTALYYKADLIAATDYSPFGAPIKQWYANDDTSGYRFGFNGKENDNEVKGVGNEQDYGMRISDTRLGRFLSVDPISSKYPELTPYQFASNTPIQAIDLDGKEAFIVHGTNQGTEHKPEEQGVNFTPESMNQFKRITGNTLFDDGFRWHAPMPPKQSSITRVTAAGDLALYIVKVRSEMIKNKTITADEPITLIGYSHGGNVSISAAKILNDAFANAGIPGFKINIITVSTPAYNTKGDPENPEGNAGINDHIQIVHDNDDVVNIAGGAEQYKNKDTKNYVIKESEIPIKGGIKAHTQLPGHALLANYLRKIPALKKAPAIPAVLNK